MLQHARELLVVEGWRRTSDVTGTRLALVYFREQVAWSLIAAGLRQKTSCSFTTVAGNITGNLSKEEDFVHTHLMLDQVGERKTLLTKLARSQVTGEL